MSATCTPSNFAPVCQLPQSPGAPIEPSVAELRPLRGADGLRRLQPQPRPERRVLDGPPLGDRYWYPLYEAMCELDVPAMVHVSAACNPHFHTTGSHYLGADTTAFMQLMMSDVFDDFPTLRFIIPHGGGAVPYHWGRFRGIAQDMKLPPLDDLLGNVYFDTCVYHQPGIDLLLQVCRSTTSCSRRRWSARSAASTPRRATTTTTPGATSTRADLSDGDRAGSTRATPGEVYPRLADDGGDG